MTSAAILDDLVTLRDWLRYAVSRFNAAGLVYGHGTSAAVDEAAFLILSTLNLDIDDADPWLDCRLTMPERRAIAEVIDVRVTTRKPAAYLTNSAWIGPHRFFVDERVIVPRSFIGELLVRDAEALVEEPQDVRRVLDLCAGSGCLAIIAALTFTDAIIDAGEISDDAAEVARRNIADYGLEDRVRLFKSDLFKDIPAQRYDVIVSNPPYVTAAAVDAFPPEYRAEPALAHLGGADGLDIAARIIDGAGERLAPGGLLVMEVGQGKDALEARFPGLPFFWLDTETSEGEVFTLTAEDLADLPA